MPNENAIRLETFPKTKADALTMLYLSHQDLSDLTPSELVKKYNEVWNEIYDLCRPSNANLDF